MVLTAMEFRRRFPAAATVILTDRTYWVPTDRWLELWWAELLAHQEWRPRRNGWRRLFGERMGKRPSPADCDDYALMGLAVARQLYTARPPDDAEAPALAFAGGLIPDGKGTGHAMVAVARGEGLALIEPQAAALKLVEATGVVRHVFG